MENQERFIIDRRGAIAFSREEGKREGREEGREEGKRELIISLLEGLLGELDLNTKERFNQLSSMELEQLSQAMLNFKNISDLVGWLDRTRNEE